MTSPFLLKPIYHLTYTQFNLTDNFYFRIWRNTFNITVYRRSIIDGNRMLTFNPRQLFGKIADIKNALDNQEDYLLSAWNGKILVTHEEMNYFLLSIITVLDHIKKEELMQEYAEMQKSIMENETQKQLELEFDYEPK